VNASNDMSALSAVAVVLEEPRRLAVKRLALTPPTPADCVVDVAWSGISTGTERLLWTGRMPAFPGMGYPLVPGYESVGRVVETGAESGRSVGAGAKLLPIPDSLGEQGVLMALAATAYHASSGANADGSRKTQPDLIIGHGVLGRLLARIAIAQDAPPPVVWETNPVRAGDAMGYDVVNPDDDARRDYRAIYDVSGDGSLLDSLIGRLAPGGEIVLAGFYEAPLSFNFPPAFMRELRLRVAAEFREPDLAAVKELVEAGRLSFDGLITHRSQVADAATAYETAFNDPTCLKMILDWSGANV
jgi:3-hydroxyethyl bacteriochlorophyllide a dehydrogenase